MSTFWSLWIIVCVVVTIGGSVWLLFANRKIEVDENLPEGEIPKTGHVYDGIEEYDNPLPGWWFNMFVVTVVFAVIYLILYPGFGSFAGVLGWTSHNQWQAEVDAADKEYGPIFAKFAEQSVDELSANPQALKIGQRLFGNNCAICHGTDARGNIGFPDLTDDDWLYGGSPEAIKQTIANGRRGAMPAWGKTLGENGVDQVAAYVLSLGGADMGVEDLSGGEEKFRAYCTICHGADGKGNQMMGAPDLTDDIWLYGGTLDDVRHTIRDGRQGLMPAQSGQLKEDKIHLLAAYVYGLSRNN